MIQLNLLPDIKLQYLRAQRTKRFFMMTSLLVSGGAISVVVLMALFVYGVQGRHSANLDSDIKANLSALQATDNLAEALTIQNQLNTLPELHDSKPVMSRLFNYFSVIVPDDIELNEVSYLSGVDDGGETTIELIGQSTDFKVVNQFADALKNAQFTSDLTVDSTRAFKDVTLSTIGKSRNQALEGAPEKTSFTIRAAVDMRIFHTDENNIKLTVPTIVSSPSVTERPTQLFNTSGDEEGGAE